MNKEKKKVVLVNPPLYYENGLPRCLDVSVPPLGLLYLATYINHYSKDFQAVIIDIGAENYTLEESVRVIKEENPFVIGMTGMTPQLQGLLELARNLRENIKDETKIFLGGPHISADNDFINRFNNLFDYAITGESEKTFYEALNKLLNGEKLPKIQKGEPVVELDTIPNVDRDLIKRGLYRKDESMLFGRGCPFHCYYCSRPAISNNVRYRSIKAIIKEIRDTYKYCHGSIHFQDDTFTMRRDIIMDFCKAVKSDGLKLSWECNTRIDLVDDELLKNMAEAGCSQINFGIESGNERVRKGIINKGSFTNERIKEVFAMCKKHGIKVACYFMIGHPTETYEELMDTKNMIDTYGIDVLGLSIPTPFPGSVLYDIAKKEGVVNEKIIDKFANKELGEGYAGIYPVYVPKTLTREQVYATYRNINRKFYLNINILLEKLTEDLASPKKLWKDFNDMISLMLRGVSSRRPYRGNKKK